MRKHNPKTRLMTDEAILEAYSFYKSNEEYTVEDVACIYNMNTRTMRKYFYMVRDNELTSMSYNTVNNEPNYEARIEEARHLHQQGESIRSIADKLNFSYSTLYRRLSNV